MFFVVVFLYGWLVVFFFSPSLLEKGIGIVYFLKNGQYYTFSFFSKMILILLPSVIK